MFSALFTFMFILTVFLLPSLVLAMLIVAAMLAFRTRGQSFMEKLYVVQLLLVTSAVVLIYYLWSLERSTHQLDGPSGAFQGIEYGVAVFAGLGSQILIYFRLPWLKSKASLQKV